VKSLEPEFRVPVDDAEHVQELPLVLVDPLHLERSRGGLVVKAHRLLCHSTLGLIVIKKKKCEQLPLVLVDPLHLNTGVPRS